MGLVGTYRCANDVCGLCLVGGIHEALRRDDEEARVDCFGIGVLDGDGVDGRGGQRVVEGEVGDRSEGSGKGAVVGVVLHLCAF